MTTHSHSLLRDRKRMRTLQALRRNLASRLASVDSELSKFKSSDSSKRLSVSKLEHLLDELSIGLDNLPALPKDFSRADLYDDHD